MFGFGESEEEKRKRIEEGMKAVQEARARDEQDSMEKIPPGSMHGLWGTSNPKLIDQQMRKYMPGLMGAVETTEEISQNIERHVIQQWKNQVFMNDNINLLHDRFIENEEFLRSKLSILEKQNEEAMRKNQELQEKYNALVERMAGYIERENGKGR